MNVMIHDGWSAAQGYTAVNKGQAPWMFATEAQEASEGEPLQANWIPTINLGHEKKHVFLWLGS